MGEEFSKEYRYPATPRTKMYDFYVLSYVGDLVERPEEYAPRGHMITLEDDVKTAAEEARKTIVTKLAAEIEEDVFQSIASEMRHAAVTADRMEESAYVLVDPEVSNKRIYLWQALEETIERGKDGRITFTYWDKDKKENFRAMNLKLHQTFGTNVKQMRADAKWLRGIYEGIEVDEGGFNPGDYKKVRERVGAERERFVRLAEKVFGDHHVFWGDEFELRVEWDAMSYAGEPWAAIARGWLGLKAARSVRDQAVQIDHIYDLQHNNGSVFNKLAKYDMGDGYEWLAEVLDYKRDVRSYYELIRNFVTGKMLVSSDCRIIALRAMKAVTGKTEEGAAQRERKRVGIPQVKKLKDGTKEWYLGGKLHRGDDLPAVEMANGTKEWWQDGKRHREGGLPAVERADGTKEWYLNGNLHREGGLPAIEDSDGTKEWYLGGKRHNADGPAVVQLNGRLQYWFLDGQPLSKKEWEKRTGKKSKTYSERLGVR